MDRSRILTAIRALPFDEQVELLEQLADELRIYPVIPDEIDDETKRMLDERIKDMEANPDDCVPWEVVKDEIQKKLKSNRSK